MTLVETVKKAQNTTFTDRKGKLNSNFVKLHERLTQEQITEFGNSLPCATPDDIRALLEYCGGFEIRGECGLIEEVFFFDGRRST